MNIRELTFNIKEKIKKHFKVSPTQSIVIGFAVIILIGGFLLMLPISSRAGVWTSPIKAVFTATSATCVTGLVVFDTFTYWNGFGQIVILSLIQIGGLGFMTLATLFSFLLRRKIKLRERLVMMQSIQTIDVTGVVRITKHVLIGTLMFEGLGALILSIRFAADFGILGGIKKGIFHSVSAFCNAGFDLMGEVHPFSSLTAYQNDIVVNFVIMALIIIGGIGFIVWEDIYNAKSFKKLQIYSKFVIIFTAGLIFFGALGIFLFEFNNPATCGNLSPMGKILTAFFQSVTPRTAGFNTISINDMTPPSKIISCVLMFIGGSSGSTAGGVKVVTVAILVITAWKVARGYRDINVRARHIDIANILRALTIVICALVMIFTCSIIVLLVEKDISVMAVFFETISAFATVGLSLGITSSLSGISLFVLIILMFFGRVGILTITFALADKMSRYYGQLKYPEAKLLIG